MTTLLDFFYVNMVIYAKKKDQLANIVDFFLKWGILMKGESKRTKQEGNKQEEERDEERGDSSLIFEETDNFFSTKRGSLKAQPEQSKYARAAWGLLQEGQMRIGQG